MPKSIVRSVSSVHPLDRLGRRREMRDDSAEILFQSFLQKALVSSSGEDHIRTKQNSANITKKIESLFLTSRHFMFLYDSRRL